MLSLRTDLALESIYTHENEGICQKERKEENCKVTEISITTEEASKLVGKPMGNFVTLEFESFPDREAEALEKNANMIAKELLNDERLDKIAENIAVGIENICIKMVEVDKNPVVTATPAPSATPTATP